MFLRACHCSSFLAIAHKGHCKEWSGVSISLFFTGMMLYSQSLLGVNAKLRLTLGA
jgi:hypothetical protein